MIQLLRLAGWKDKVYPHPPACPKRYLFAHFVADDAADSCAANGSDWTSAGQNGTPDGTNASANSRVLILPRHADTTAQTEQHYCGNHAE